jgi:hypothetical protein
VIPIGSATSTPASAAGPERAGLSLLRNMRGAVAACAFASVVAACSAFDGPQGEADCIDLSCVEPGRSYDYRPTRAATPPVEQPASPTGALPESAYTAIDSAATHRVTFSAGLHEVELVALEDGQRLKGEQRERIANRIVYALDAFAGGEFVASSSASQSDVEAELTLFGSGVPIVASSRGVLEPRRGAP